MAGKKMVDYELIKNSNNDVKAVRLVYMDEIYSQQVIRTFKSFVKTYGTCTVMDLQDFCDGPYRFLDYFRAKNIDPMYYGWTASTGVKLRKGYNFFNQVVWVIDFPKPVKLTMEGDV